MGIVLQEAAFLISIELISLTATTCALDDVSHTIDIEMLVEVAVTREDGGYPYEIQTGPVAGFAFTAGIGRFVCEDKLIWFRCE